MVSIKDSQMVKEMIEGIIEKLEDAGYPIHNPVSAYIAPDLNIMGYSFEKRDSHTIVVAGFALGKKMLAGLVTHELCHIYLTEHGHPSHDSRLIYRIVGKAAMRHKIENVEALRSQVNHVQDILADDILFKVCLIEPFSVPKRDVQDFFVDWVKEHDGRSRWERAEQMVSNAFAIGNLRRHGLLKGVEKKIRAKNHHFLDASGMADKDFAWFEGFLAGLKPKVSHKSFEEQMYRYLEKFVKIAKG